MERTKINNWKKLSLKKKTKCAKKLVKVLPKGFKFVHVKEFSLGGISHTTAQYEYKKSLFSLIPGGNVTLGYDKNNSAKLTKDQLEEWEWTIEQLGLPPLLEFLPEILTPLRTVDIPPFLIEVDSIPSEAISPGVSDNKKAAFSGKNKASTMEPGSYNYVVENLEKGFRLPSSDEWEYACSGGARTLFRWGDYCPVDCYPVDWTDFDLYKRPNAFGLMIAINPYLWEFVSDPGLMRGGDGGSAICGGTGFVSGWLRLASSYLFTHNKISADEGIFYAHLRRVVSVDFSGIL